MKSRVCNSTSVFYSAVFDPKERVVVGVSGWQLGMRLGFEAGVGIVGCSFGQCGWKCEACVLRASFVYSEEIKYSTATNQPFKLGKFYNLRVGATR